MPKSGKRKQAEVEQKPKSATKSAKTSNGLKETAKDPYPNHPLPTPEECLSVRDDLLAFHGFPKEFAEYRKQRLIYRDADGTGISELPDLKESVLDGLVRTLLSQNTTEVNSQKAFAFLKSAFPTWEDVSFVLFSVFELLFFFGCVGMIAFRILRSNCMILETKKIISLISAS